MDKTSQIAVLSLVPSEEVAYALLHSITGSSSLEWAISNKYYTANISFEVYTTIETLLASGKGTPAVLVIASELEQVTKDQILSRVAWDELEISLVLRVDPSQLEAPLPSHEFDSWQSECLEAGFEFVDACGELEENAEGGLERVKEALQAHLWPSSKLSDPSNLVRGTGFDDDFALFQTGGNLTLEFDEEDASLDSFENFASVLSHVKAMRDHAATIDDLEQRRAFAEQVSAQISGIMSRD